jgi:hypothetical protein
VQEITGENIELAYVDQGYTGENAAQAADKHGVRLEVANIPRSSADSCCCRVAGWWSAALPGRPASVAWPETTSGRLRPLLDFTTSPSQPLCSQIWLGNSRKVNNRL